ncbi:MAG TPA: GntR family transcriptional regulator [Firmicutes bacterium]|nr:GntR family transcriptional regulator [Bacillota bacterium]
MKIQPIKKTDLDTLTYERLREMIQNRILQPGQRLVQDKLTEMLGVSRTPLRKALSQLEKEQLVCITPKGTYVRRFTLEDMIIAFEVRAALEGLAARLLAPQIKKVDVEQMRELFTSVMTRAESEDITAAYLEADQEFHTMIAAKLNSGILMGQLNPLIFLTISYRPGLRRLPEETYPEHMRLIAALEAHDEAEAEEAAKAHLRATINHLCRQSGPELASESSKQKAKGRRRVK